MGLNATPFAGTLARQNQISGEYQRMNASGSKAADKAGWKGQSIGLAKLLLNEAGNFLVDQLVGIGMVTGGLRAEEAPAAKALIKNVAVKIFRYIYIDGPARCADKVVQDMADSRMKQLHREASYRFFQASAIVLPLFIPCFDGIFRGYDELERVIFSKMFDENKLHTA